MLTDIVLALGLLLTTATQLRVGGTPFGFGEVCLLLWLFLMAIRNLPRRDLRLGPALTRLLAFWALLTLSLCIGTITAFATGEDYDSGLFLHDAMAYPLLAAVSCVSVIEPGAQARLNRVAWLLAVLGGLSLCILIAGGEGLVPLPVDPWFWERFRGWSQNPNQLSLLCCVLALICLHLADISVRPSDRIVALLCMAVAICAGRMTQGDTFTYALVVAGPVFAYIKLRAWVTTSGSRAAIAALALVAVPMVLVSSLPSALSAASDAGEVVSALSKNGGKEAKQEADLRLLLWRQAIGRGFESGMLGLGPGPHLRIPVEVVVGRISMDQPGNTEHPRQGSAANFEAHNTVLDLFTQGGLIAAGSFAWLMIQAGRRTYQLGAAGLVALLCGISICCMTGNVIRLPVVWFALALCLVAERQQPSTAELVRVR